VQPNNDRQRQALAYLKDWDGDTGRESVASSIYHAWFTHLGYAVFEDDLSKGLFEEVSQRPYPLFLAAVMSDPKAYAGWCDNVLTPPVESCDDTARVALDAALDDLSGRLGNNMANWQWGKIHLTQYPHTPFSQVALLRPFFHRKIANGGDSYTVNAATIDLANLYDQRLTPSYRQIVDFGNLGQSLFMHTTGQSGNLLSRYYDDLIERHRAVQYLPMSFGRNAVSGDVLTLTPK
jgi:penicillin amidase